MAVTMLQIGGFSRSPHRDVSDDCRHKIQPGVGRFCQDAQAAARAALASKLFELAKRGGSNLNLEGRQTLDHGIEIGRGGLWLDLSEEQSLVHLWFRFSFWGSVFSLKRYSYNTHCGLCFTFPVSQQFLQCLQ